MQLQIQNNTIASRALAFIRLWFSGIHKHSIMHEAAAMTFISLLSLVPALSFIMWVTSRILSSSEVARIEQGLLNIVVSDSADSLKQIFHDLITQASVISIASLPLLFFATISLMNNLEKSFNKIFQSQSRKFLRKLGFLVTTILLGPILLAFTLTASDWIINSLNAVGWISKSIYVSFVHRILETLIFALIYKLIPAQSVSWVLSLFGGLLLSISLSVLAYAFQETLVSLGSYQLVYGIFVAVPLFFLWIYSFWVTVFILATLLHNIRVITQETTR